MNVLQTHVLVCVYVILGNRLIRLRNKKTLATVRDHSKQNRNTTKFNKEFTWHLEFSSP